MTQLGLRQYDDEHRLSRHLSGCLMQQAEQCQAGDGDGRYVADAGLVERRPQDRVASERIITYQHGRAVYEGITHHVALPLFAV